VTVAPRGTVAAALALGILAVSTAAILIRWAQLGAPSLAIATGRLAIATLVLLPAALQGHRGAWRGRPRRDLALAAFAGLLLAAHFATWIASLERTTVARSVVLVSTVPLWAALGGRVLLGERLARGTALGLLLALSGGVLIGLAAPGGAAGAGAVAGDLLALAGAWAMAGYLLAARRLRATIPLVPYVTTVYGLGALALGAALAATRTDLGRITPAAWGWIALLALVPQLVGHSTFNWALRHLPVTVVAVALLGEPVGSTALAWALLGERPGPLELAGGVLILAGIYVVASAPAAGAGAASRP
jgi:drug/metabolite transporter (DMT)-like permease